MRNDYEMILLRNRYVITEILLCNRNRNRNRCVMNEISLRNRGAIAMTSPRNRNKNCSTTDITAKSRNLSLLNHFAFVVQRL
jgi:hypothetical protein